MEISPHSNLQPHSKRSIDYRIFPHYSGARIQKFPYQKPPPKIYFHLSSKNDNIQRPRTKIHLRLQCQRNNSHVRQYQPNQMGNNCSKQNLKSDTCTKLQNLHCICFREYKKKSRKKSKELFHLQSCTLDGEIMKSTNC